MIQRIQTLYLFLAGALVAITLFTPSVTLSCVENEYTIKAFEITHNIEKSHQTIMQGILLVISTLLPLATIFLYKNRKLQMRLCGAEIVLLSANLAFIGAYASQIWDKIEKLPEAAHSIKIGAIMPLVAIVLVAMALRSIHRDEKLVRSLDRIR